MNASAFDFSNRQCDASVSVHVTAWIRFCGSLGILIFLTCSGPQFVWRPDGYETFLPPQADSGNSKSIIPSEYENTISLIAINYRTIHSYDVRNQNTRWDQIFMMFAIVSPVPCDRNAFGFGSFLLIHALQQCTFKHSSIFFSLISKLALMHFASGKDTVVCNDLLFRYQIVDLFRGTKSP